MFDNLLKTIKFRDDFEEYNDNYKGNYYGNNEEIYHDNNEEENKDEEQISEFDLPIITDDEMENNKERVKFIKENCEQIQNAVKELDDTSLEYKIVASYIGDIQKIEMNEGVEKKRLVETATKIDKLIKEKEKLKARRPIKLKANQYAMLEKYEDTMVDEIKKMKEYEQENSNIKHDLSRLEGERGALKYERSKIVAYQNFLKKHTKSMAAVMIVLYVIFALISVTKEKDMTVAFAIVTMIAAIATLYIIIASKNNEYKAHINELKMNKLIKLFNKIKIKYVNSVKLVEYVNSKFGVKNSKELSYLWEKYIIEKDSKEKFYENVELLSIYMNAFTRDLMRFDLNDNDIWKNQVSAIVNPEELFTLRQNLDDRRLKLKDRIDYNSKLYNIGVANLKRIGNKKEEYKKEIDFMLEKYDINI